MAHADSLREPPARKFTRGQRRFTIGMLVLCAVILGVLFIPAWRPARHPRRSGRT